MFSTIERECKHHKLWSQCCNAFLVAWDLSRARDVATVIKRRVFGSETKGDKRIKETVLVISKLGLQIFCFPGDFEMRSDCPYNGY